MNLEWHFADRNEKKMIGKLKILEGEFYFMNLEWHFADRSEKNDR